VTRANNLGFREFAIYIKKYLKPKKEFWKLKIFPHAYNKYNLPTIL
jgi:hypothetical protein